MMVVVVEEDGEDGEADPSRHHDHQRRQVEGKDLEVEVCKL